MPIVRMMMKLYRRLMARLQFLMRDGLTETGHASAHAQNRESVSAHAKRNIFRRFRREEAVGADYPKETERREL